MTLENNNLSALFEGRCPPPREEPSKPREELHINKQKAIACVMDIGNHAALEYDGIHRGDPRNTQREGRSADHELRTYYVQRLSEGPPVSFAVTKRFSKIKDAGEGFYPPRQVGQEFVALDFDLFHDAPEAEYEKLPLWKKIASGEIGTFKLEPHGNEWELMDRFVDEKYRGQGIASLLSCAVESFVQAYAEKTGTPQKIVINIGQPTVLSMFLKRGYKPSTAEDKHRIDQVLSGDESLELDYAIVRSEGEWAKNIFKDLYCFRRDCLVKTEVNAFRIRLEKDFVPSQSGVEAQRNFVRKEVQDV